jgi:hypothetical protein
MNITESAGQNSATSVDRRNAASRRRQALPLLFAGPRRRRSKGRRKTDEVGYVDLYDSQSWVVAISILSLSLLDAVMTCRHILYEKGSEANPIMDAIIRWGGFYPFIGFKAAMTAFPLAILILHKEWRLAQFAARICLWSYILIALYHFYLVSI